MKLLRYSFLLNFYFILTIHQYSFSHSQFVTKGILDLKNQETIASVDKHIITTKDIYDFAKIKCILIKAKKIDQCIDKNKIESFQNLIQIKMQIAFFEKNNLLSAIEENKMNFSQYLKTVEKESGLTKDKIEKNNINYNLFVESEKARFLMMLLLNHGNQTQVDKKNQKNQKEIEENLKDSSVDLMNKIKNQITVDIK